MSYMAFVIGINVATEGCCWCAYIVNTEIELIEKPVFTSIFVAIDIFMDLLYFSCCFLNIVNELDSDTEWYDYLVCLSEGNIFLYFTLLFPIYKISSAVKTLDNYWYQDTIRKSVTSIKKLPGESSRSRKLLITKLIGCFFSLTLSIGGAVYLITWTKSHLEQ